MKMWLDQMMYQRLIKAKDFGVIFGALGKGITEKLNA